MTPGARTQASIELLAEILEAWQSPMRVPADKLIDQYFKARRFMGSKDRAFVGELVYWILRHLESLRWHAEKQSVSEADARTLTLCALALRGHHSKQDIVHMFSDNKYAPAPLTMQENALYKKLEKGHLFDKAMPHPVRYNYPAWLEDRLKSSLKQDCDAVLEALNKQAPTDLRANLLKTTRDQLQESLRQEGFETTPTPSSPWGLRLKKRAPIFTSNAFKQGHFEVQDEGSQMISKIVDAKPSHRVIDFCAGAGGKTLGIAATMQNKGRILAWDNSEKRLSQIHRRLKRAGVDNVQTHVILGETDAFIKRHKRTADRVLTDVPCSGSGTWRRNPDLKWRFTPEDLANITATQQAILTSAARLVKPGGRLIYATCSLLEEENARQVEKFVKNNPDFRVVCAQKIWDNVSLNNDNEPVSYLWVTPHHDGVDGFFAAVMLRKNA